MKTVLITGATSGIGLAIANKLYQGGFTVYGTSRSPDKHHKNVAFELLPVGITITSEESIQNCVSALSAKSPVIDVLVNNAGIDINGSAEETSSALARKRFDTNFWGVVNMTKAILSLMRQQRNGQIITVGALGG
jgi:NADP-dependent 3-hydroxy acid dehydrogenase YdfG